MLLEGIRGVTLYGADGRLTYATGTGVPGQSVPRHHLREALKGVTVSEVSGNGAQAAFWTYVPVVVGPPRTIGVAAFELDYAPIEVAARRSSWLIAGVLEALLLLLFLILAPAFGRVTARIRRHVGELEHAATYDELTGMPNRLGFRRVAEDMLATGGSSGALLLIDLDGFSEINDGLGSSGGDTLLAQVGERLRRELSDCEVVARMGEDEFAALIRNRSREAITAVADRVERSLTEPFVVDGVRIAVTVSIGAARLGAHGIDLATVLRRAGAALITAKEAGQSKLQIYDSRYEASDSSRVALTAEWLRDALEAGQLVRSLPATGRTSQARSVPWRRGAQVPVGSTPERGLLTAGTFISQAERGRARDRASPRFVLETSAAQWQEWSKLGDATLELRALTSARSTCSTPHSRTRLRACSIGTRSHLGT